MHCKGLVKAESFQWNRWKISSQADPDYVSENSGGYELLALSLRWLDLLAVGQMCSCHVRTTCWWTCMSVVTWWWNYWTSFPRCLMAITRQATLWAQLSRLRSNLWWDTVTVRLLTLAWNSWLFYLSVKNVCSCASIFWQSRWFLSLCVCVCVCVCVWVCKQKKVCSRAKLCQAPPSPTSLHAYVYFYTEEACVCN